MDLHYFRCDVCNKFQGGSSYNFVYQNENDDYGGLYLTCCKLCWNLPKVKYLLKNVSDFDKHPFFQECTEADFYGILEEIEKILKTKKEGSNG